MECKRVSTSCQIVTFDNTHKYNWYNSLTGVCLKVGFYIYK